MMILVATLRLICMSFFIVGTSAFVSPKFGNAGRITTCKNMVPVPEMTASIDEFSSVSNAIISTMMVSETEAWVQPLANVLGPFLNLFSFAMVSREKDKTHH